MTLIIGLGNPGSPYASTRHNIGWRVLAQAAQDWSIALSPNEMAIFGEGVLGLHPVGLAMPLAWMNQTGSVVLGLLQNLEISSGHLIVVHDDLDMDLGRVRVKTHGGPGGHNGLRSLILALDTQEFIRIKVGIGRPEPGHDMANYVLSPFLPEEESIMNSATRQAVEVLECVVGRGVQEAMNRFNVRPPIEEES